MVVKPKRNWTMTHLNRLSGVSCNRDEEQPKQKRQYMQPHAKFGCHFLQDSDNCVFPYAVDSLCQLSVCKCAMFILVFVIKQRKWPIYLFISTLIHTANSYRKYRNRYVTIEYRCKTGPENERRNNSSPR